VYTLVNIVIRYTRSSNLRNARNDGYIFHKRVSQNLPKKLGSLVFAAVEVFFAVNTLSTIVKATKPYLEFTRKSKKENVAASVTSVFQLHSLEPYLQDIDWNSDVADPSWVPEEVDKISTLKEGPKNLHKGGAVHKNFAYRVVAWIRHDLKPHEMPIALLLHVMKRMNILNPTKLTGSSMRTLFDFCSPR
jgi:hypothetical protein